VRATLVVARDPSVFVVLPGGERREGPLGRTAPDGGRLHRPLPPTLARELEGLPASTAIVACGAELADAVREQLGRPVVRADAASWHSALRAVPAAERAAERRQFLQRAHRDVEEALRSPDEVLVSLAREEERSERSVGREARAAEAFVAVPGTVLADVAAAWQQTRDRLADHHRELQRRLELEARRTAPNLSALFGPRTAARLVAAAGGLGALARMSSSRLQLLGSRRRPSPERGPRHGVLYRADGMDEIPPGRRGAYARSLGALGVIAARADAYTHADIAAGLARRRDLRSARLRRGRR
jgi:hypothetical protein